MRLLTVVDTVALPLLLYGFVFSSECSSASLFEALSDIS
jgi:hypothetical protein